MSDDHAPALDPDDLDISKSEYVRKLGEDRYVVSAGEGPPRVPHSDESEQSEDTNEERSNETATADAPEPTEMRAETAEGTRSSGPADRRQGSSAPPTEPETIRERTTSARERTGGNASSDPPKRDAAPRQGVPRGAPSRGGDARASAGEVDAAGVGRWLAESLSDTAFEYGFDATLSVDDETTRHRMVSNDVTTAFETLALWFARSAAGDDMPPERALGILLAEMDAEIRMPTAALARAVARHGLSAEDSIGDLLAAAERENGLGLD